MKNQIATNWKLLNKVKKGREADTDLVYIPLRHWEPSHLHKYKSLSWQVYCQKHCILQYESKDLVHDKVRHTSHWYKPVYLGSQRQFYTQVQVVLGSQVFAHNMREGFRAEYFLDSGMQHCGSVHSRWRWMHMVSWHMDLHSADCGMLCQMDSPYQHSIPHAHNG